MDANKHIESVITAYLAKPPFGALLITGAWGAGKTHIIKQNDALKSSGSVFITLNGVDSSAEIRKLIIYSAFPALGNKTFRTLGGLAKSALGVVRFNLDINLDDLVEIDNIDLIVADDLERIIFDMREALGYFNSLCEHEHKHVILLADYEQLEKFDHFREIQEKTIGKIVSVIANYGSLIESLKNDIDDDYHMSLLKNSRDIERIFVCLASSNLRILKQIVYEFEEVFLHIYKLKWINSDIINNIFFQFTIFSLAWKLGLLDRKELSARSSYQYSGIFDEKKKSKKSTVELLAEKFSHQEVYNLYIDNEYLIEKVCDGLSNFTLLDRGLSDLQSQSDPTANPEWRILWHYLDHDEETIRASYQKLRQKFADRQYLKGGEILHIFGIKLEMHRAKLDRRALGTIIAECKKYIDDLYKSGGLPILSDDVRDSWRFGAAYGLGFTNGETNEFKSLSSYYQKKSSTLRHEQLVRNLNFLLSDIDQNIDLIDSTLTGFSNEMSVLRDAVLSQIKSRDLASAILVCSGYTQSRMLKALGQRYYNNPDLIRSEGGWLKSLKKNLQRKTDKLAAPAPHKMRRLIELTIEETIRKWEESNKDDKA